MTQITNPLEKRLEERARNDEQTVEETIGRLLDETGVDVELETVVEKIVDEFDSISAIFFNHRPALENPSRFIITVCAGDIDNPEEYVQIFTPDHRIKIERDDETILVPFSVCGTCNEPLMYDSKQITTIYMRNNVLGAELVPLQDGLPYLQDKLENPEKWSQEYGP